MCNTCTSTLRCLENLPGIGHLVAACYACAKNKDKAERAGIKATIGIIFFAINFPAEVIDELGRKVSWKLRTSGLTPRPGWMRNHRHKIIRNLCLPASHQSATYTIHKKLRAVPMVEGWSKCQKISIDAQLYGGIRFLDLRLMNQCNDIWCHHNLVICVKLKDVLESVRDFINDNKSEMVFLYMTSDGKPLEWPTVNALVNEYLGTRLAFESQRDMLIGDIIDQGKQVVIFGVPNVAYSWQKLHYRWPNKAWPNDLKDDLEDNLSEMSISRPNDLFWYKAECTPNAAMVARCIGGLPGVCAARCADEKFDFLEDLASAVNHCVNETIKGIVRLPFNVLSTDYVNDDIVERIVEMNNDVPPGAHLSMSCSAEVLDDSAYLMTQGASYDAQVQVANQTHSSLSTNFSYPPLTMPPVEVRETCT